MDLRGPSPFFVLTILGESPIFAIVITQRL